MKKKFIFLLELYALFKLTILIYDLKKKSNKYDDNFTEKKRKIIIFTKDSFQTI